ncbi:TPA: metallophosphoesterase [Stenotrophomonas maltophilia]|jgi:predicted phosphodiesterase|nr:metallophosphoesterase [Stenotrophomonas maltophilia]HDS3804662.1 metallophosphoesterase [Stenotrophomonas maltophilia]HDX0812830.1 metallophosphoesterase [Stenotrophomonas maltophilia]HDX0830200.1 metallophosphoesterase [Stenotrophomonas maltophilia]HDX0847690.1 metallophosphoesterase [Stenotrophomonas maltophilia]
MSDLHLEVWRDAPADAQHLASTLLKNLSSSSPDAVVLAGDMDLGDRAVAWAQTASADIPAVYVPGNNEASG